MEEIKKELSGVIENLARQVSIKEVGTRDFVHEMADLYYKIDELEQQIYDSEVKNQEQKEKIINLELKLYNYEKKYVISAKKLKEEERKMEKKHLTWQVHREYMKRENEMLKIIIEQLTAQRTNSMPKIDIIDIEEENKNC